MKILELENDLGKKITFIVDHIKTIGEDSEGYSIISTGHGGYLVKISYEELIVKLELVGHNRV